MHQSRENYRVLQFSGLLLGLSLFSYHVRELLVCWLFFALLFVSLVLLLLGGVLASLAGKYVIHWASTAASVRPVVALASVELHLKPVSDAEKFNCSAPR